MAKTNGKKPAGTEVVSAPETPAVEYSVMPHIVRIYDHDGKYEERQNGFMLARKAGQRTDYCGQGFNWRPHPLVTGPFPSEEEAQKQLGFHVTQEAKRSQHYEVATFRVEVPCCHLPTTCRGVSQVSMRLSPDESWMVNSIMTALQQMQAVTMAGQKIDTQASAIRWMINEVFAALEET